MSGRSSILFASNASLYQWAVEGGYDEKEIKQEWYDLHSELSTKRKAPSSSIDSLKAELRSVNKAIADFDRQKNDALTKLHNVEVFDSDTVFSEEILQAAALARVFDKKAFSEFKGAITLRNRNTKDKKVSVSDWLANVKDKAEEINSQQNDLLTRRNAIQAQIKSLSFIADNDVLQGFSFPAGYSVTLDDGIVKVEGEKVTPVCRRPVVIKSKTYHVDEKIYKLGLAYQLTTGKWKTLTAKEAAIVFNRNKLLT